MPSSNSSHLKETLESHLSFQDWLEPHLGAKPSPNTDIWISLLPGNLTILHHMCIIICSPTKFISSLKRTNVLFTTFYPRQCLWSCIGIYYITLSIVEMSIWVTRKMHFPVFMFLSLISGSILEGEGVGCTKWVIIRIWKWSQREREEQKI